MTLCMSSEKIRLGKSQKANLRFRSLHHFNRSKTGLVNGEQTRKRGYGMEVKQQQCSSRYTC